MQFTAIDFETANSARSSACSVGLSIVENGEIVERVHQLLRPQPSHFDPMNVSIHGIKPTDVLMAPSFAEYWPELRAKVRGPLVAHNAAFDMSVLRSALDKSAAPYPETDYFCTVVISKLTWPDRATYKLNHIAESLGIAFAHHDAAEDARACAMVALKACREQGVASLYDLKDACGLRIGSLHPQGYTPCGAPRRTRTRRC